MFKGLAKYNYLGSIEEFRFLTENVLSSDRPVTYAEVEHECVRKPFLFRNGVMPVLDLLILLDVITRIADERFLLNLKVDEIDSRNDLTTLVLDRLLAKLRFYDEFDSIFEEESIQYDISNDTYSVRSYHIKPYLGNIKRLLIDLKFFSVDKRMRTSLNISKRYVDLFERTIRIGSRKRFSLEKLKELNELNERLGKEAELFVLRTEQQRLKGHNSFERIQRIAETNVLAGYDIESFRSLESGQPDRFIEVKSFSKGVRFFWSIGEVETAKELGSSYCLCLVDRDKMNEPHYEPSFVFDPFKEIFSQSGIWDQQVTKWLITKRTLK